MHPHRCHSPWHPQFPLWQSSTARASPTACPLLCSRPHAYPIHAILQISLPKPTTYMMTLAKNVKLCKVLSSPNYHIPQSFCCEAFIHPVKSINNNTIHTHNTQPTGGKFPTLPVLCTARNHHRSQGVSKGLIGGFERPPIGDTTHCSVHAIISQRWWLNHPIWKILVKLDHFPK